MNIVIKGNNYDSNKIADTYRKGTKVIMANVKTTNLDKAVIRGDLDAFILVPDADNKLMVVLKPNKPTTIGYLLSKYQLKNCVVGVEYAPTQPQYQGQRALQPRPNYGSRYTSDQRSYDY